MEIIWQEGRLDGEYSKSHPEAELLEEADFHPEVNVLALADRELHPEVNVLALADKELHPEVDSHPVDSHPEVNVLALAV